MIEVPVFHGVPYFLVDYLSSDRHLRVSVRDKRLTVHSDVNVCLIINEKILFILRDEISDVV